MSLADTANAQTTSATITGTVTDPTGAVVSNATVTATNVATGIVTAAKSNEAGAYTIAQLKEGTYTVRAETAGFKSFVVENVGLVARDVRRVDVKLEVGDVATQVEVAGGATLIETETARITDTKSSTILNTIPTNSRGMWAYLTLAPGVQNQQGTVRFAGSRDIENNWAIDGTTFADGVDNTATGPLANYIESFQEVKIDLSNNSAEFGALGQVTIVSKSGTNQLHGTVFDYYTTPWFRARSFFSSARATGIQHLPGAAVGGPVWIPKIYSGKNRTFFYYSYETSRGSSVQDRLNPTVAPVPWRTGDFFGLSTPIIDPLNGQPFPNNKIPSERLNPVSLKIQQKFFPLPNYGDPNTFMTQNYRELKIRPYDPSTYWTSRIDQRFSDKDQVFGRYTWSRLYNRNWEGNLPTIGQRWQQRDDRAATIAHTHSFRANLLNELRWGFGLNNNPINYDLSRGSTQHGLQLVQDLGLVGLAPNLPDINGILNMSFSNGMTGLYQYPWRAKGYRTHTEEVNEQLSWFRGRHNLKFGAKLLRSEYDDYGANTNLFGNVRFTNRFTGAPYADFLLGIPTTASRAFPPVEVDRNRWAYDFFALDDFKVNSKLTLNLGLRYELHLNWRENHNLMSLFDTGSGKIVVPDAALSQISPIFPKSYVGIASASSVGFDSNTLVHLDKNNFAPRIGLAWRPWDNNTVFRAGWGIFYNVVPYLFALDIGGVPFVLNEPAYTNPVNNPQVIFPRVFPTTGTGGPSLVGLPAAENPNFKTPYSFQYSATMERQQWNTGFRISYVGTAMRQGPWEYNYNSPIPNNQLYINKPRPFANYSDILYDTNGSGHQYNGMTLEALRQFSGGLYFQSSWTWARDRYDMDWVDVQENPFDRHREIAPAQEIPTHRFSSNFIYEIPVGRGRHFGRGMSKLANLLVGGWEISGIYTLQTGMFLTPFWSGDDPVGIFYTTSDPASITIRPNILKNPSNGPHTIARWFDPNAFAPPSPGQFGTSAKGVVKGPGVNVFAAGLHKDFSWGERAKIRWEMTTNNLFNHPNWANPSTNITDSSVGVITSDGGVNSGSVGDRATSRSFRMGIRAQF
jgi:hypothetical protein